MSTTTAFVELLIIGMQALVWITLLMGALFGLQWTTELITAFEKAEALTTVGVLGFAYFMGILMDEFFEFLIDPWARRIRKGVREEGSPELWTMEAYVFGHAESAIRKMEYVRSRVRICRSSTFNIALATVFALVFFETRSPFSEPLQSNLRLFVGLAGVTLTAVAIFVFWRIERSYWLGTQALYKSLEQVRSASQIPG